MSEFMVYNPHNKLVDELPVIYGFVAGVLDSERDVFSGRILAEDGVDLLGYGVGCKLEDIPRRLGMIEPSCRHVDFKKHYPNGYRTFFVPYEEGFLEALVKYDKRQREKQARI